MKTPPLLAVAACALGSLTAAAAAPAQRPHIVLVMADDMGWGETSYNGHPLLKTPHLDAMAAAGLRFDRFYAGAPNCSPTRATVMTGRSNDRAGVQNHGYALRRQEKTLPQALRAAGYATGHFGKWHLNGFSGPGAPVLSEDDHHPGEFGFDEWLSVTNFFDRDPLMSRKGRIEELRGDSSEIIVGEALKFIAARAKEKPTFTVIWYGSPHAPFVASEADRAAFASLDEKSRHHYGELVALDRSIGALRRGLRDLKLADNTLLFFCSDNGGLPEVKPSTVASLRGFKNSVFEGGLRVPAILEWPAVVKPRVTKFPAGTIDLFPTIAELVGLPKDALLNPVDGTSLVKLLAADLPRRDKPLVFRHTGRAALIDNRYKILTQRIGPEGIFELYDLESDPAEAKNLFNEKPDVAARMRTALLEWNASVERSVAGLDYPEGKVHANEPGTRPWRTDAMYRPHLEAWKNRPELMAAPGKKVE